MIRFLNTRKALLIVILILAAFLRFWNLGSVPPSTSMDEASIAYNAYSVLKTGGDEYGEFPLISQRGYDDWRRSTYLFLVIPFVNFFGLNSISVRLPAVILSVFTVLATYYITLSLFKKKSTFVLNVALIASLLLAISPWHIYISRLGHESNACLSFLVFGILFFLQGQEKNSWKLILISVIFFTLSTISYYSGQVFIPLLGAGAFFLFWKKLFSIILLSKKVIIIFSIFAILLIPIIFVIFSPKSLVRFQGTSTFKPDAHIEMYTKEVKLRNDALSKNNIIGLIFYNRHLFPVKVFIQGYVSHFKLEWLFTNAQDERFKVPNLGLLYLWDLPLIVIGIFYFIFKSEIESKVKKFIFLWFFLAPVPAALATEAPHAIRSYNFLPTWQIFAAFGFVYIFLVFRKNKFLFGTIFLCVFLFSLLTFYKSYFFVFPKEQSKSFHYALSKVIPFVIAREKEYKKIVFSNNHNLYQSYMLFLYYSQYDPVLYQRQGGTVSGGYAETHKFGKYEFRPIDWKNEKKNVLYIGNIEDFSPQVRTKKIFEDLNGISTIKVVEKLNE